MPALPFGGTLHLGRCSADLQVLISGNIVLELVGFEEIFQLLHVALVKPVHLLLGGMQCLLHLDGFPHCKTQRWVVIQSRNHWRHRVFPPQWSSEQINILSPSLSILFLSHRFYDVNNSKILIYQLYSQQAFACIISSVILTILGCQNLLLFLFDCWRNEVQGG